MATARSRSLLSAIRSSSPATSSQHTSSIARRPHSLRPDALASSFAAWNICPSCRRAATRSFATTPRAQYSSRRQLMTESASPYRPKMMPVSSPPPRNMPAPETSIAGGRKEDVSAAKESWPGRVPPAPKAAQQEATQAISEQQAQQPAPLPAASTVKAFPSSTPKPSVRPAGKSRLRARKAAMTLTPSAVEHLRELLDMPEPKLIRVGVKNKGCSGSAYHLEYVDKPAMFDEQVEQDGVKVLIDSKALIKVIGSEMDWVEDKLSARFTFRNPNITEQCGCGESFSIG